ncbi:MAG: DUF2029 domain-containing protein [Promethearchaeota archaeon]|nr:MAG: DUF2029 domain-containing protein [Candidatus Lokiarchaeota archaeon]
MKLKGELMEFRNNFSSLWKFSFFKIAIIVQIGYIIVSIILYLTIFYSENDFIVFYNAGRRILFDIDNLYFKDSSEFFFRYFPFSAIFYIPFSLLDFNIAFLAFMFFNLILNVGICVLMFKIIRLIKKKEKIREENLARYFALFLGASPQVNNYILGQNNLLVIFLILLAIYLFIKKKNLKGEFLASVLIGISISIKPITFLAVPFLIVLNYNTNQKKFTFNIKKSVIRIIGISILLLPNIIFFCILPQLWEGFLINNFTGGNITELRHSFSITKLILNFLVYFNIPFNQIAILLVLLLFIGTIGYLIFIISNPEKKSVIYGLTMGILIMLLVYFDTWDHHLLILLPLLILIIFDLPEDSKIRNKYIKSSVIFFVFLDLVFMGLWHIIKSWFPYNFLPTIFLILSFYGIAKIRIENKLSESLELRI